MNTIHTAALLALLACASVCNADELHMKNGSKLVGKLIRAENDHVIFDMPFAPNTVIKTANIRNVITEDPVTLMMMDGTIYKDRRIASTETHLVARADGQEPVLFATSDIRRINPEPWRLGDGYRWTGTLSAALESERGNSDTDEWDLAARTEWRSLKNRFTINGTSELDEANGEKSSDNWKVLFKYDRFRDRDANTYYGAKARFEYDRFADLDLRSIVGPHIGRQFLKADVLTLQGEVGPVLVDEKFDVSEDNDFPGGMWAFEVTSDLLGFGTTLFVHHDGILNFDDPNDLILNTRFGIKMPLLFGLQTGIDAEYDYDGGAVDGVDTMDETYNLRIGYSW